MSGETIEYKVVVDAVAADQNIKKLSTSLSEVQVSASKASASIVKYESAARSVKGPTTNVGMAALEASRAFEDLQYGIGGVVNNIPSLVMALGGTAGITAAISVAAVSVNQLVKAFSSIDDSAGQAVDAASKHIDDLAKAISDADEELMSLTRNAAQARIYAQKAVVEEAATATARERKTFTEQFGINPLDIKEMDRIASLAQQGLSTWTRVWNSQKQQFEDVRIAASDVMAAYRKTTDAYSLAVDEQVLLGKYEAIEKERLAIATQDAAIDAANAITENEQKQAQKRSENAEKQAKKDLDWQQRLLLGQRDMGDIVAQAAEGREKMLNDIAWRASQLRIGIAEEEAQSISSIVIGSMGGLDQIATGAVSTVASGIQQMATDMITGQEHIAERFGALVMQQAGQSLISSGTKLAGEAVVSAFTPGAQAIAVSQAGASAALIASGIGLGGVAAGLEHVAAGGTLGKKLDKDGAKDRGASSRKNYADGKGGGPLVINVSYGVAGPLPEDTAREIAKAQRAGARRGGA